MLRPPQMSTYVPKRRLQASVTAAIPTSFVISRGPFGRVQFSYSPVTAVRRAVSGLWRKDIFPGAGRDGRTAYGHPVAIREVLCASASQPEPRQVPEPRDLSAAGGSTIDSTLSPGTCCENPDCAGASFGYSGMATGKTR
jgi:hypothetical protein